jgi:hypothetical protein
MSDYEIKNRNTSLNLMSSRLGLFNAPAPAPVAGDGVAEEAALHGLDHGETLLKYNGGVAQQDRMIKDKRRSLDRALKYSYQGAFIKKVDDTAVPWGFKPIGADDTNIIRALINPNKLKPDYDDKILSVPYEHGFKAGDIFEWCNTDTKWLITSQNKTELAYFRGDIRRCNYILRWLDDDKNIHECYAATRGPVETKINFIQKQGISVDTPNHSLNILMPKREDVLKYFQRYQTFYLMSSLYDEDPESFSWICFRVEATDHISTPGVFEMTAVEYYGNLHEDNVEEGLVGALLPKEQEVEKSTHAMKGPTFIKPLQEVEYKYVGMFKTGFEVDSKYPVELKIDEKDATKCTVKWTAMQSGQFELKCSGKTQTIVVESLF